ncbi:batten's disease protein Cln3 [Acaromyces ingoldii]|uniref:Protein BTN n=1 Tax=Acaromyces ingoldii TaxID=215250 RepID=A0A316YX88_9BASI|nr:batten's disease protein Cln3 [Acaromyces ingoldii]PWN93879.1 batten's disease protein Cln3 [Acaromyces ingoldii]
MSDPIPMRDLNAAAQGGHSWNSSLNQGTRDDDMTPMSALPPRSSSAPRWGWRPLQRQAVSLFLFGLLNNSLYVVILTAALELLPKGVPTGVVSFANIAPALIAKAVWPYVLRGRVRYAKRIWSCVAMSLWGILVVALWPELWTRLLGISLASFSSGLGELTFLQLSTRYGQKGAGRAIGWFSSGTGAAGLVGASAWWIVRPMGVKAGLITLSFIPVLMGITYAFILPSPEAVRAELEQEKEDGYTLVFDNEHVDDGGQEPVDDVRVNEEAQGEGRRGFKGARKSTDDEERREDEAEDAALLAVSPHASNISSDGSDLQQQARTSVKLSARDKLHLIKPMFFVYIFPLVLVYFFEYTINQGIAPTLLYPLPTRAEHPLLSLMIKQLKDYYPLYQLTYQTFVFLSRSSISILHLPAIPKRYLWVPAVLQGLLMLVLATESLYAWFRASIASPLVIVLVCVEGLAGGGAYVSVFYQIGTEDDEAAVRLGEGDEIGGEMRGEEGAEARAQAEARRAQEHEFRIGCVGVGDTLGILIASLLSMPLQVGLCDAQVRSGRELCKQV